METTIDVAFLSTGRRAPASDGNLFASTKPVAADGFGLNPLRAGLRAQGLALGDTIVINVGTGQARAELAAALRAPAASFRAIAVLDADVLVNAPPLGAVLDDPRVRTGALSFVDGGRPVHLGVLKVDAADRGVAAELVGTGSNRLESPAELIVELTRALSGSGVPVQPVPLGGYAWAHPADREQADTAATQLAGVDERAVRLREAARGGDGFYSTFVLRRLSWRLTGLVERSGLTPNQVTLISFGLGLLAATLLALGSRPGAVLGALLLQFCLVVDCVDGELARYRRRFSRFGAWLDATTDRVKEFAVIAALAVGAARSGGDLWGLVAAAIAVQTFRNLLDLGWSWQRGSETAEPPAPSAAEWVTSPTSFRASRPLRTDPGALTWARRIGHFPIGERFLLISLGAALWTPRGTLITLLLAGLLSAGYLLAAFVVRSRPAAVGVSSSSRLAGLADVGPLLGAMIRQAGTHRVDPVGSVGRLAAILPALIAVAELALSWWLAVEVAGARPSTGVVLLAVTAIAHYQQAYGVREGVAGSDSFVVGTDLRLTALALVIALPALLLAGPAAGSWANAAVWGLAGLVAASSTVRSLRAWTRPQSSNQSGQSEAEPTEPTGQRAPAGGPR